MIEPDTHCCAPSSRKAFPGFALVALLATWTTACAPSADDERPPRLSSVEQIRAIDPSGATLELVFDEALNDVSAEDVAHYHASNGSEARWAVLLADEATVRVAFDAALVPGETTLAVDGVLDRAGNPSAPVAFFPLGSDDVMPPALASAQAISVPGPENDRIELVFDDELVLADVLDPACISLEHPLGSPIGLGGVTLEYDAPAHTLVLVLTTNGAQAVNLHTGGTWRVDLGPMRDLGGNALAAGTNVSGAVGGDSTPPSLVAATQNLVVDATGRVVDLAFSEVLDGARCADPTACAGSGGQSPLDVSQLWPGDLLRVVFDQPLVPGVDSLMLENVFDLAGNQLVVIPVQPLAAADSIAPTLASVAATAWSGHANDTVVIRFSEPVLPADAADLARFALFLGAEVPLAGSAIVHDASTFTTTITLSQVHLTTGSIYALTCTGVRDTAGNRIAAGSGAFEIVSGDALAPAALAAEQNTVIDPLGRVIDVRFDEPVMLDAYPLPVLTVSGGCALVSMQSLAGDTAVRLLLDQPPMPGTTTIAVSGLRDPAGNQAADALLTIVSADALAPSLVGASATAVQGVANDSLTVTFSEQMVPAEAMFHARWALLSPIGTDVVLASALFSYDTLTRAVTIQLPLDVNLATGATFELCATAIHDVAGNPLALGACVQGTVAGDATAPIIMVADRNQTADPASRIVDVTFSEPVSAATAQVAANYNVSGTPNTQSATLLLDGRTVRLYTTAAVTAGTTTIAVSGVRDLASNLMLVAPTVAIVP